MEITDLMSMLDASELNWDGGKGWKNAYGQRTHQNDGWCEIDDIALRFQRLPRVMQDDPTRYVYYIEQIVEIDVINEIEVIDVIAGPAFAASETEAKQRLLEAVKRLIAGPELIAA